MAAQETIKMVDFHEKLSVERLRSLQDLLKLFSDLIKDKEQSFIVTEGPVVDLLENHLKCGGELKCHEIDMESAKRFEELLMFYKVPYYGVSGKAEKNEEKVYFITRDSDEERLGKVINHLDFELRTRLGWIAIEDFFDINGGNTGYMVNVSDEELPHFADNVFNKDVRFTIEFLSDGGCDIYFMPESKETMESCLSSMADELGITDRERLKSQECIFGKDLLDRILLREAENNIHNKYNDEENTISLGH